ncbi:MAG: hypothetical protein HZB53_22590 [Chloroflexi bacterium]|nr:hypothetical protein [Chloroflexota bacterium]
MSHKLYRISVTCMIAARDLYGNQVSRPAVPHADTTTSLLSLGALLACLLAGLLGVFTLFRRLRKPRRPSGPPALMMPR